MKVPVIQLSDAILILLFAVLMISMSLFYQNYKISFDKRYKWFTTSFIIRLIGGFTFGLIYIYYYGGGDTVMYYDGASRMYSLFFETPVGFFKVLCSNYNELPIEFEYLKAQIRYLRSEEEWFLVRIASIFSLISFNSFWVITMFFSTTAFIASWLMHLFVTSFFNKFKNIEVISLLSFMFVPSVIFWGSGILKDTISFSFLLMFFFFFNRFFIQKSWNIFNLFLLIISLFFVYKIKSYVILTFLPALGVGIYVYYKSSISNLVIKYLTLPFIGFFSVILMIITLGKLADQTQKYKVEDLNSRMRGFHSWHTHQGGSTYSLGEFDYSTSGIIKKFPAALNVSLFRPYIFEVRSAVMLISSLENTLFILIFIIIFWYFKLNLFIISFNNYFLSICFVYFVLLGIVTGITSYNFGALARYRIPYLPFFVFWLFYFFNQKKIEVNK